MIDPNRRAIAGSLAQRPGRGGHTWVFLQYLLGFRRLGWDVLFLDWLDPTMAVDWAGRTGPEERSVNARYLHDVMVEWNLGDDFALLGGDGRVVCGLPREH